MKETQATYYGVTLVVSHDLDPLVTLCGTRIPSHEDEETSHTSQGIISISSLVYTSTQGMDEEKSPTYLFNVSHGKGQARYFNYYVITCYTSYNELP